MVWLVFPVVIDTGLTTQPVGFSQAICDCPQQNSIAGELQKLFWIILEIFCDNTGVDIIEFTGSVFRDEKVHIKLQQFSPALFDNLQKQRAA